MKTVPWEDLVLLHYLTIININIIKIITIYKIIIIIILMLMFSIRSLPKKQIWHDFPDDNDFDADLPDIFCQVFDDLYRNLFARLQLGCSDSTSSRITIFGPGTRNLFQLTRREFLSFNLMFRDKNEHFFQSHALRREQECIFRFVLSCDMGWLTIVVVFWLFSVVV